MKINEYWELKTLLQKEKPIWADEVCEIVKKEIVRKLNNSYDVLKEEYELNNAELVLNSMDEIAKQLETLNS